MRLSPANNESCNKIRTNQKRRDQKNAIIAITRMMIVSIYHLISEKKPFEPTDEEELMNPQNDQKRVILNKSNIFDYPETLGYGSSTLVKRNDN